MYRHLGWVRGVLMLVCLVVCSTGCTWLVPEFDAPSFNAEHGDTVNVVMLPFDTVSGTPWDRCVEMGGVDLVWSPDTLLLVCESVDF